MATVNKILLPRRAKESVMKSPTKSVIVLEKGEMFVECSDDGIGNGHVKIKIGDGVTPYKDLGYAVGDTSNDQITFQESSDTDIATIITNLITNSPLNKLIANIKKAIIILKNNDDNTNTKFTNLTAQNAITEVRLVDALPADAGSNPTVLYLIKS